MPETTDRFVLIKRFHGGHRIWKDGRTGRIAVSDQSGDGYTRLQGFILGTPDRCDDGVLLLDRERPIKAASGADGFSVPLTDERGRRCSTAASPEEALWIAAAFRMRIACPRHDFTLESPLGGLPEARNDERPDDYGA